MATIHPIERSDVVLDQSTAESKLDRLLCDLQELGAANVDGFSKGDRARWHHLAEKALDSLALMKGCQLLSRQKVSR